MSMFSGLYKSYLFRIENSAKKISFYQFKVLKLNLILSINVFTNIKRLSLITKFINGISSLNIYICNYSNKAL